MASTKAPLHHRLALPYQCPCKRRLKASRGCQLPAYGASGACRSSYNITCRTQCFLPSKSCPRMKYLRQRLGRCRSKMGWVVEFARIAKIRLTPAPFRFGEMARVTGLEPATSGVTGRHSNRLSYTRAFPPRLPDGGTRCRPWATLPSSRFVLFNEGIASGYTFRTDQSNEGIASGLLPITCEVIGLYDLARYQMRFSILWDSNERRHRRNH